MELAPASIDKCENCRYWSKTAASVRTWIGVCMIMSNPVPYDNTIAYVTAPGAAEVLTRSDFHCTLYKVAA